MATSAQDLLLAVQAASQGELKKAMRYANAAVAAAHRGYTLRGDCEELTGAPWF